MQVRKYFAQNMKEALKMVRKDLGSQAIILSTNTIGGKIACGNTNGTKRGVEIVAALDYDFDSSGVATKSLSQSSQSKVSHWKDLLSNSVSLENVRRELEELKIMVASSPHIWEEGRTDLISAELKELKWMTQFLLRQTPLLNRGITPEEYTEVISLLEELGIENGWVQEIGASGNYQPDFYREGHPFNSILSGSG